MGYIITFKDDTIMKFDSAHTMSVEVDGRVVIKTAGKPIFAETLEDIKTITCRTKCGIFILM